MMNHNSSLSPLLVTPNVKLEDQDKSGKSRKFQSILRTPSLLETRITSCSTSSTGSRKRVRLRTHFDLLSSSKKERLLSPIHSCSQNTPSFLYKRFTSRKSRYSTKKLSLDALLDPDVEPVWCIEMATPPKIIEVLNGGEADCIVPIQNKSTEESPKKGVARVLFQVTNEKHNTETAPDISNDNFLRLMDSVLDVEESDVNLSPSLVSFNKEHNHDGERKRYIDQLNVLHSPCVLTKIECESDVLLNSKDSVLDTSPSLSLNFDTFYSPPVLSHYKRKSSLLLTESFKKVNSRSSGIGSMEISKNSKFNESKFCDDVVPDVNDDLFFSPPIANTVQKNQTSWTISKDIKVLSQSTPIVSTAFQINSSSLTAHSVDLSKKNNAEGRHLTTQKSKQIFAPDNTGVNSSNLSVAEIEVTNVPDVIDDGNEDLSPPILSNFKNDEISNLQLDKKLAQASIEELSSVSGVWRNSLLSLSSDSMQYVNDTMLQGIQKNEIKQQESFLNQKRISTAPSNVVCNKSIELHNDIDINCMIFDSMYCQYSNNESKSRSKSFLYPKAKCRKHTRGLDNVSEFKNLTDNHVFTSGWFNSHLGIKTIPQEVFNTHKLLEIPSQKFIEVNSELSSETFIDMDILTQIPSQELKEKMDINTNNIITSDQESIDTNTSKQIKLIEKSIEVPFSKRNSSQCKINADKVPRICIQPISGKNSEISEESIKAAKKMFEDEEALAVFDRNDKKFTGFQTGLGRKVEISEESIKAARKMFEDEEALAVSDRKDKKFTGFQTGLGKKVEISEESIKAARKMFEDEEALAVSDRNDKKFTGFQTGLGKKVEISEESIKAAKKMFEDEEALAVSDRKDKKFTGFQTGLGKKVEISEESIKAARKMFEDEEAQAVSDRKDKKFTGFQTGLGKKVEISEESIKAAKKMFEDEEKPTASDRNNKKFTGFQTGLGKKVEISVESIKAARKMFEDEETPVVSDRKDKKFTGFQTGLGKKVEISEESIKAAKKMFEDEETPAVSDRNDKKFTSFQTGLGKNDQASEKSFTAFTKNQDELESSSLTRNTTIKAMPCGSQRIIANYLPADSLKAKHLGCQQIEITPHRPTTHRRLQSISRNTKKKISYTSPAAYQHDRDISFKRPFKSAYSSPDIEMTKESSRVECIGAKLKSSFVTPFKATSVNYVSSNDKNGKEILEEKSYSFYPFGRKRSNTRKTDESKPGKRLVIQRNGKLFDLKKRVKQSIGGFVNYVAPQNLSRQELYHYGLTDDIIDVNFENALSFCFRVEDHFSEIVMKKGYVIIGDGIKIMFEDKLSIGNEEFKCAFKSCEEVDATLISDAWIDNHFKQIVWKLASYSRRFPEQFAGSCLTPSNVMYQLKYRYDKEIDHAKRSCLKRIYERDDISSWRMVLCVCRINLHRSQQQNKEKSPIPLEQANTIELTDGWYSIKCSIDQPMSQFVEHGKISVGTKLCISGAELIGSEQGCMPLEAPESLMLRICTNSTRRASWESKLGYQMKREAFPIPLRTVCANGGTVGCVKVVILRKYPMQWMEKCDGRCVFRNSLEEESVQKKYDNEKQKKMKELYTKLEKEFEQQLNSGDKRKRKRNSLTKDIKLLRDGKEIYEALEHAEDPTLLETMLSTSQKHMASDYKRNLSEMQQGKLMDSFKNEWKLISDEEFPERISIQLQRYRVADINNTDQTDVMLTVWKPTHDICDSWKEGATLGIYNLNASQSRYKQCSSQVQLSTTNLTKYTMIEEILDTSYSQRRIYPIKDIYSLSFSPPYFEIDVVGYVIRIESVTNSREQIIYLSDDSKMFLAIKFCNGFQAFGLYNLVKVGMLVAFTNLSLQKFHTPHRKRIIYSVFTDLSLFTRNPKEKYLEEAFNVCSSNIKNKGSFLSAMTNKLDEITHAGSKSVSLKPFNFNSSDLEGTSSTSRPDEIHLVNRPINSEGEKVSLLSNASNTTFTENTSGDLPSEKLQLRHKLQIKKRLVLERYREPPALSQLPNSDEIIIKSRSRLPRILKPR